MGIGNQQVAQVVKNLPADAGSPASIPGSGTSPEGGNGNLLQYSCLENFMDRGAWWATAHGGHRVLHDLGTHKSYNTRLTFLLLFFNQTANY